jgi:DNA-binding transcriptional regulator YhcF (GntR family)
MTAKVDNHLWVEREFQPLLRGLTLKTLREAILARRLRPGERLVERTLCQQTGVSRSSIREALRYLESEGLVESRGSKGMFVSVLSSKQALEIYEVRAALEARPPKHTAERATGEELKALRRAYEGCQGRLFRPGCHGRIDGVLRNSFTAMPAQPPMRSAPLRARINLLRRPSVSQRRNGPRARSPR